jgi:8-oxo-dGTP diphosphatase
MMARRDGNGFLKSTYNNRERYYGLYGAAGLLLVAPAPDGPLSALLQLRATWKRLLP